jgi:two-component system, cell cycle sensor histidine kinase and response regulator CckA
MYECVRDAQRLKSIARLASGFAHHLNNVLTVIVGHVEMAWERTGHEEVRTNLRAIRQASQRATLLTRQILTFAGKQFIQPKEINLNDHIEDMRPALRRLLGDEIELVTRLNPELWTVKVDPSQMQMLLVNLAVNAQEAMPDGGTVSITTANVGPDDMRAQRETDVTPGDYIMLAFTDTGAGMTEETARHVFDPFFSTKELGVDTVGLGLSVCYGIVTQHGGQIRAHSGPEKGSTFRIYLPRLAPAMDAATPRY